MKIKIVTTHTISFSIQSFGETEAGMHHNSFGLACADIGAAIASLQLAKTLNDGFDWIIVCDVHTDVGTSEV